MMRVLHDDAKREGLDGHLHGERLEASLRIRALRASSDPIGSQRRTMNPRSIRAILAGAALFACLGARVSGQTPETAGEFWPTIDIHAQLRSDVRLLAIGGLESGEDFAYRQWFAGAGLGYQWERFSKPHPANIDPDKEHVLVAGVGYEYLDTVQSGSTKRENRLVVEATPRLRPPFELLVSDRNRVEFRWVNGDYSTRYRNRVTVERDFLIREFHLAPYASAELFYDGANHWYEERYAAGLQLPYKRSFKFSAYYLRQNCTTCSPAHLNVVGMTVDVFLGSGE